VPNVALDILVNVVRTKILLIFISLSSLVFIFVLVLVSSTIIQNVFVIFVIVFVVVDEKNTGDKWLHKFNPEKCKVMHVGHSIPTEYMIQEDDKTFKLDTVDKEKDLGIYVTNNMKAATQCKAAAQKAMNILRTIKRHFFRMDEPTFLILYQSHVRPHLQYCIQAWSPHFRKDIDCLEQIL